MMTENISRRDWEHLSAYLDNQLSAKESDRLSARLKTDKKLLTAFEELQMARNTMNQLPYLRAPRNFTVTPEMIGARKRKPSRLYPAFRLASVLTSFLFVFIMVGDFFSSGALTMQKDLAAPAMAPAAEVYEEESLEAEPIMGDAQLDVEDGLSEVDSAPEREPYTSAEEGIVSEEIASEKTTEEMVGEPNAAMPESPAPLADTETQERELISTTPMDTTSEVENQTDIAEIDHQGEQTTPILEASGILWLPLLKIIMGAAAVVTTIAAFTLRKRER
ncbi:MAG: hypothetical protein ABFS03_04650 [Chloroflexota bacterium]